MQQTHPLLLRAHARDQQIFLINQILFHLHQVFVSSHSKNWTSIFKNEKVINFAEKPWSGAHGAGLSICKLWFLRYLRSEA